MTDSADVSALVAKMQALKAEHRELLELIGADRGMAPETRQALLAHLLEEEDELVAQIARAAPKSGEGERASAPAPGRPKLTVGSLRGEPMGSLRRE